MDNINIIDSANNHNNEKKKEKNALIELYRFFFALWVVYYHGFFFMKNQFFNHGYISVEFFFILSGYYLIKSIDKFKDMPLLKGVSKFCLKRVKSLGLPFAISLIFVVWYMIWEGQITMLGYMWYIPFMLLAFIVIFILRKYIKSDKWFILTLTSIVIVSYLVLYLPLLEGWGLFRALGGVSLGVIVSFIPKPKFKWQSLTLIISLLLFLLVLYLAYLPKANLVSEYFLVLLILPALIYFSGATNVKNKAFVFLGSLSFGLYAYQCVVRVVEIYFPLEMHWLFLLLVCLTLISRLVEHTISYTLNKSKQ